MRTTSAIAAGWLVLAASPASAASAVSCAGVALLGAAQMVCSHVAPKAPTQYCTFKWELVTAANQMQLQQGAFVVPPGASNVQVYQGAGYVRAAAPPIVLCQGRKGAG